MNIFINPLTYFAIVLIIAGLYFIFSKEKAKVGGPVISVVPWMAGISRSFNLLFGLSPENNRPVEIPEKVKRLFGACFLLVGLALLVMMWVIYQM